jgi:hypothetical protein
MSALPWNSSRQNRSQPSGKHFKNLNPMMQVSELSISFESIHNCNLIPSAADPDMLQDQSRRQDYREIPKEPVCAT